MAVSASSVLFVMAFVLTIVQFRLLRHGVAG
jgi:hypothetical protein